MSFSSQCKASSYLCILNPAKLHQTKSKIFCFWFQWTLIDVWFPPRYPGMLAILISNTILSAPGRVGVTAREHSRNANTTLPQCLGAPGSGRKGLLCTWEQSVVRTNPFSIFAARNKANGFANPCVVLLAVFWAQRSLWGVRTSAFYSLFHPELSTLFSTQLGGPTVFYLTERAGLHLSQCFA